MSNSDATKVALARELSQIWHLLDAKTKLASACKNAGRVAEETDARAAAHAALDSLIDKVAQIEADTDFEQAMHNLGYVKLMAKSGAPGGKST